MNAPSNDRPPHEDLRVWHNAVELAVATHHESSRWPREERYGYISQVRRATVSIVANIAEGKARSGVRQYRAFVQIAYGSAREVQALLTLAKAVGIADDAQYTRLTGLLTPVLRQLLRLMQSLGSQ